MADNIDSLSIQITADVSSAESSIDRLIGKLSQLKTAVSSASNFQKVASGIKDIVDAAKGIDPDTGERLSGLAKGLDALSKSGSLSHLKGAGKIISEIAAAAAQVGADAGNRLFNLAQGLNAFQGVDTQKLREVRDAIGQTSSGIGTGINAGRAQPSSGVAALGSGTGSSFGGLEVFKFIPDEIHDATNAFEEFGDEVRGTADVIETVFTDADYEAPVTGSHAMDDMADAADQAGNAAGWLRDVLGSIGRVGGNALTPIGYLLRDIGRAAWSGVTGLGKFFTSLVRIAKYRAIRALLKDMVQSFKDLYGWSDLHGTQFAKSMDMLTTSATYLRNSIAAMISPLINMLAPAFDYVTDRVVELLNWINQFFSVLSGADTYTVAKKVKVEWGDTFDSTSKKAKKASDAIKRTILGFDEINRLTKEKTSGSGSTGSSPYTTGYETMFEEKKITGGFKGFSDAIQKALSDTMSRLTMIVQGSMLALGAILALSGANVPLGLALMAAGAVGLASTIIANWDEIGDTIKTVVGVIEGILSGGLAVGAILAFSGGNIPLGIALMAGAISAGGGAVNLLWSTLSDKISGEVQKIAGIVSLATLGIGAVLAFSGVNVPLGIAMIAAGVTGTAASLVWGGGLDKNVYNALKRIMGVVSLGAVAVGAILALTGVNVPLGIGLIAGGIVGAIANIDWKSMENSVYGSLKRIIGIVSLGALAVGAILTLTGVNIPLGIGLIAAGMVGTAVTMDWTAMEGDIFLSLIRIVGIISAASVAVGAILALTGVNIPLGVTLIAAGAWGTIHTLDKDAFPDEIQSLLDKVSGIISTAGLVLGIIAMLTGNIPLGIGLMLPAILEIGKSVVENWDGLVALGTKAIEKIKEGWDAAKEFVVDVVVKIAGKIWDGITGFWNWLWNPSGDGGDLNKMASVDVEIDALQGKGWVTNTAADPTMWTPDGTQNMAATIGIDASLDKVNGNNWTGGDNASFWDMLFPKASAEGYTISADVKANQYSQDWYNQNIAPLEAGVKQQPIEVPVNLVKSAASTVATLISSLFGGKKEKEQKIDVKTNLVKGDVSLLQQIEDTPLTVKIQLQKKDWTTMDRFLDLERVHYASIGLVKSAWTTMVKFLDLENTHAANIELQKSKWTTMTAFLDLDRVHTAMIALEKRMWSTMDNFLTLDVIHEAMIGLTKYGWTLMKTFLTLDQAYEALIKLSKYGWKSVWDFVTGGKTPVVTVDVVLNNASGYKSVGDFARGRKSNSTINKNGVSAEDMPAVANMAMSAAGAAYMGGAVSGGDVYSPVSNNSTTYENNNYGSDPAAIAAEMDALAELMRQANDYLRQINEKEFSAEITTSSVNRAMQRTNRRAGTTIVAVGT